MNIRGFELISERERPSVLVLPSGLSAKLNDVLLFVLLFFALFDSARNYTYLPSSFGYVKDIAVYALIFLNWQKLKLPRALGYGFYIWALTVMLFAALGFINSGFSKVQIVIAIFKWPELFLLIIIFCNYDTLFAAKRSFAVRFFVYGCAVLCIINIVGYYIPNPIVYRGIGRMGSLLAYVGRITVGQPAVAIFPVILSFIYLLVYGRTLLDRVLLVIYLGCIILATSNTGIVSVVLAIVIVAIAGLSKREFAIRFNIGLLLVTGVLSVPLLLLFNVQGSESIALMYSSKIGAVSSGGEDPSMTVRYTNWAQAFATMADIDWLVGRGAYGYGLNEMRAYVENTYVSTLVTYGILGLIGLLCFFIRVILHQLKVLISKDMDDAAIQGSLFILCIMMTAMLHMYTLDIYQLFSMTCSIAFFIGLFAFQTGYIQKATKSAIQRIDCNKSTNVLVPRFNMIS